MHGQISHEELRQFCDDAIKKQTVNVRKPEITVDRIASVLSYSLGNAWFPSGVDLNKPVDPLYPAIDEQLRVAVIRAYRTSRIQRNFWNPVLADVEKEISALMAEIATTSDVERRGALVDGRRNAIDDIYHAAMSRYASDQGLSEAVKSDSAGAAFSVNLFTNPAGGKIYLIVAGEYDLHQLRMRSSNGNANGISEPVWEAVEQTQGVVLEGAYWFKVEWNGETRYKDFVRIRSASDIVFKPKN